MFQKFYVKDFFFLFNKRLNSKKEGFFLTIKLNKTHFN